MIYEFVDLSILSYFIWLIYILIGEFYNKIKYYICLLRLNLRKLVRSVKWGWGLWHGDAFRAKRAEFISAVVTSFCSCQCAPLLKRECLCLCHIDTTKDDNMCDRCFWIKEVGCSSVTLKQLVWLGTQGSGEDALYQKPIFFCSLLCHYVCRTTY